MRYNITKIYWCNRKTFCDNWIKPLNHEADNKDREGGGRQSQEGSLRSERKAAAWRLRLRETSAEGASLPGQSISRAAPAFVQGRISHTSWVSGACAYSRMSVLKHRAQRDFIFTAWGDFLFQKIHKSKKKKKRISQIGKKINKTLTNPRMWILFGKKCDYFKS